MESQYHRYARNIARLGKDGQKKLNNSKVLICGLGGLGSGVLAALAGYGIGELGLLDFDVVGLSNLNRQFIHRDCDVGNAKISSAARFLEEFNPEIKKILYTKKMDRANLQDFATNIKTHDFEVIVDCFDNFEGKFLLNRLAALTGVPLVHGGVEGFYGQVMTIKPAETACLSCVLGSYKEFAHNDGPNASNPTEPPAALPSVVNAVSSIQANECVKILLEKGGSASTDVGRVLYNKLLRLDLLKYEFKIADLEKNPQCDVCAF